MTPFAFMYNITIAVMNCNDKSVSRYAQDMALDPYKMTTGYMQPEVGPGSIGVQ